MSLRVNNFFILIIFFSFTFCKNEEIAASKISLCPIEDFNSPCWIAKGEKNDFSIARVNGVEIKKSVLLRTYEKGGFPSINDALNFLIEREILSQKAFKDGYYRDDLLKKIFKRALVQRFLIDKFEIGYNENSIPQKDIREVFEKNPLVRMKYDHLDWFSIQSLQWICCPKGDKECQERERRCFEEAGSAMNIIYNEIKDRVKDEKSLSEIMGEIKIRFFDVQFRETQFFYDSKKPYEKQTTWNIMDRAIVDAVYKMKKGDLAPALKSDYGWHIIYLRDFRPEEHRTLNDIEVEKELRTLLIPKWREKEFYDFLAKLKKEYRVKYIGEGSKNEK